MKTGILGRNKRSKIEILQVKNSQSYVSEQYDNLKSEYDELTKIKDVQEKEIKKLKTQLSELAINETKGADKIDAVEQYGRRQNLEIVGVPEKEGEYTNKIVIEVAKSLRKWKLPRSIITSTSHHLLVRPKRNASETQTPPPIIA